MTSLIDNINDHQEQIVYIDAHVLLNLLNELGESDKMRLLGNELNELNNTRA